MKKNHNPVFGVAGAIIEKDRKILMVKETGEIAKDMWNIPSGHINEKENPLDSTAREVKEETGFDFAPTHILGVYSSVNERAGKKFNMVIHSVKIVFVGNISDKNPSGLSGDVSEIRWFTPEEIDGMNPDMIRNIDIKLMIKDYLSGKKYSLELLKHIINK